MPPKVFSVSPDGIEAERYTIDIPVPKCWEVYQDESPGLGQPGRIFYYNTISKKSYWEIPPPMQLIVRVPVDEENIDILVGTFPCTPERPMRQGAEYSMNQYTDYKKLPTLPYDPDDARIKAVSSMNPRECYTTEPQIYRRQIPVPRNRPRPPPAPLLTDTPQTDDDDSSLTFGSFGPTRYDRR